MVLFCVFECNLYTNLDRRWDSIADHFIVHLDSHLYRSEYCDSNKPNESSRFFFILFRSFNSNNMYLIFGLRLCNRFNIIVSSKKKSCSFHANSSFFNEQVVFVGHLRHSDCGFRISLVKPVRPLASLDSSKQYLPVKRCPQDDLLDPPLAISVLEHLASD